MATCYKCRCSLPAGTGVRTKVLAGYNNRRKNGYVLMCSACSTSTNQGNLVVGLIGLALMGVLAAIFAIAKSASH
jgi:hypothetical protein